MRDKSYGWHDDTLRIEFIDNSKDIIKHYTLDEYYFGYMALSRFMRDCCYSCKYSDKNASDIIISDFWNIINTKYQNLDDNKGISMAVSNTEQGDLCILQMDNVEFWSLDLSECEYAFFENASPDSQSANKRIKEKTFFLI